MREEERKKNKNQAKVLFQVWLRWIYVSFCSISMNQLTCNMENCPALQSGPLRMLHVHAFTDKDDTEPPRLKGPDFLHRRFTGIRWWNKDLIFIWQGSQSQAGWSGPLSLSHSQHHIPPAYLKQPFRGNIRPWTSSSSKFNTKRKECHFSKEKNAYTNSINGALYRVTSFSDLRWVWLNI